MVVIDARLHGVHGVHGVRWLYMQALPGRKADASNRDPNHLTSAELDGSVWFHALRQQRESLVPTFGDGTHASAM